MNLNDLACKFYQEGRNWNYEVGAGNVPGVTGSFLFGHVPNATLGVTATIWEQGGLITLPSTDSTFYISSSSASDTDQVFTLALLDENKDAVTVASPILTGQTPIAITGGTYTRCNGAFLSATGSNTLGDIYITTASDHTAGVPNNQNEVLGKIPAGKNNLQNGVFTIPNGIEGRSERVRIFLGAAKGGIIDLRFLFDGGHPITVATFPMFENAVENSFPTPGIIPAKTDICWEITPDSNNTPASVGVGFHLVDKSLI